MSIAFHIRLLLTRFFVWLALLWERSVPVFFPAVLFPALYIALSLFGMWERFGDPWRFFALIASIVLCFYYLYQGVRAFRWPSIEAQARRMEQDAALAGRPLELLSDHPAQNENPQSAALWQAQQRRARQALKRLGPKKPRAALARLDVYGLRAAAMVLIFAGFVIAGPRAGARLDEAFAPRFLSQIVTNAKSEAWITGPDYALLAPKFLSADHDGPIEALTGSDFHLKISGTRKAPILRLRVDGKKHRIKFTKTGPQSYDVSIRIDQNSVLELSRPLSRLWQIKAQADKPPRVLFTKAPYGDTADALSFSYAARDDVGIAALELVLERTEGKTKKVDSTLLELPAKNAKALDEKTMLDFTRHRWAGLPVTVTLIAHDGAGHNGRSRPYEITLPDKLFVNPMAKAIAEQRTLLIRTDAPYAPMPPRPALSAEDVRARPPFAQDNPAERLQRAPAPVRRSAALMRASLRAPEMFFDDPLVYVGLRYAAENLRLARRPADYKDLDDELWALALWAEGGALADARAAMKAAERAFRRALARGAPADELARLMHNYERSVKRYLEVLAEEALRNGQNAKNGGGASATMDGNTLQEMLDALKALSETGARGDARKLLQALSELLEKMKMQLAAGSGGGNDPVSDAMRKALEELGDITAEQREILDEAFRQQQQSQGGKSGAKGLAGEQKGLGERLRALTDEQEKDGSSGAIGDLKEGADEMGQAAGALKEGDLGEALRAQKDALAALRDGSEALASDLLDHIQKQNGKGAGENRDPFGRPTRGGGSQSADGTSVPDVINAERAREILQLLRDRAAEQGRTDEELNYLDRLLERF